MLNIANIYGAGNYSWENSNFTIINNTIADNGSSVIVKGKIKAPPVVGPRPGNTPSIKPNSCLLYTSPSPRD